MKPRWLLVLSALMVFAPIYARGTGPAQAQSTSRTFTETGKTVKGRFLAYWDAHGGLAQQGFPISEEMQETSETNGKTYAGVLRNEDANSLTVVTAEGATLHLPKNQIDTRDRGDSAMPADVMKHLSKSELRDLVEYLAGQKAEVK